MQRGYLMRLGVGEAILRSVRTLRVEGYNQCELDYLFRDLVIPNFSYDLSVYGSSPVELSTVTLPT